MKASCDDREPDSSDPADEATIIALEMGRATADRFIAALRRHGLWARELEVHLPLEG